MERRRHPLIPSGGRTRFQILNKMVNVIEIEKDGLAHEMAHLRLGGGMRCGESGVRYLQEIDRVSVAEGI
jgi:hypothetical protein